MNKNYLSQTILGRLVHFKYNPDNWITQKHSNTRYVLWFFFGPVVSNDGIKAFQVSVGPWVLIWSKLPEVSSGRA